ncbi:hypothetical protein QLQ12_40040 [Actinoplanes sp. NEAU-A12]|uniref:Uncharacterized protein n=1 Tax=Actinoplanes sandaracinus TaxID=3045177 RepID=A0ABT6WYI7_9ACTN|nr:hypothetical protein [Actinoplanes sandaracinus]MDI6104799.1 hypothetical protein [Actinoplanes sandaracinus]
MRVSKIEPWAEFNEYEGQLEGEVANTLLTCHVVMNSGELWRQISIGDVVRIDLWLERSGSIGKSLAKDAAELVQLEGVQYRATGEVVASVGEEVLLATDPQLRVDLDIPSTMAFALPRLGESIEVSGTLRAELAEDWRPGPGPVPRGRVQQHSRVPQRELRSG